MVMEQNHYPGATNRSLARRVDTICLPSEAAKASLGGVGVVTGNPVRAEFAAIGEPPSAPALSLLIFGGSCFVKFSAPFSTKRPSMVLTVRGLHAFAATNSSTICLAAIGALDQTTCITCHSASEILGTRLIRCSHVNSLRMRNLSMFTFVIVLLRLSRKN